MGMNCCKALEVKYLNQLQKVAFGGLRQVRSETLPPLEGKVETMTQIQQDQVALGFGLVGSGQFSSLTLNTTTTTTFHFIHLCKQIKSGNIENKNPEMI